MARKPEKAMKGLVARNNHFMEASSKKELATKLASQMGGIFEEWEGVVISAVDGKHLVEVMRGGKRGYRTRTEAERSAAQAKEPARFQSNKVAVLA